MLSPFSFNSSFFFALDDCHDIIPQSIVCCSLMISSSSLSTVVAQCPTSIHRGVGSMLQKLEYLFCLGVVLQSLGSAAQTEMAWMVWGCLLDWGGVGIRGDKALMPAVLGYTTPLLFPPKSCWWISATCWLYFERRGCRCISFVDSKGRCQ